MNTQFNSGDDSSLSGDFSPLEPIAIVGIGCRLPGGVESPADYWTLLASGTDAITEVPASRYKVEKFYDPDNTKPGRTNSKWGGFVKQPVEEFDAAFFGFSPREAACLDPLQRWLLEVSWEAFEDAGQQPEALKGQNVGVFIGAFTLDYNVMQLGEANREQIEAHTGTGGAMTMLSARLSYLYDLRGPSLALDTACSSSMVAVHLACQSIWAGESVMALAGGVNAMFTPEYSITNSKAGMLSPNGRCKSFDAAADGYVRGEGAAIVLLKPLSAALADGDDIYALIQGSACNQDGRSEGITVPNGEAQEAAMREACRRAGVRGGDLQYLEAHGTGTPVGDPIEVNALANVLREGRPEQGKCLIGSVKSNIGHTEAVAGVASLIKVALCLKHGELPATLHFSKPNPKIAFDRLCVDVVREHQPWPPTDSRRLAGINCFGFGGTNTHIVVSEAPQLPSAPALSRASGGYLLPLSAKTPAALKDYAANCFEALQQQSDVAIEDFRHAVACRRSHHPVRTALVGKTPADLVAALGTFLASDEAIVPAAPAQAGPVFVFSGMGPQWWAMARLLLLQHAVFRAAVDEVDGYFMQLAGWSIVDALLQKEESSLMKETAAAQPANFAIQVGLLAVYAAQGIRPAAVVGHSAGEPAAAYAAGIYSLGDATRIIYHRSRLQQQTAGQGGMLAAALTEAQAEAYLLPYRGLVSIAAVNSASSLTLGGDEVALGAIASELQNRGIFCRHLTVRVPYHTHLMDPIKGELLASLQGIEAHEAKIPLYSTVYGQQIGADQFDAQYWWLNVRQSVLFHAALSSLIDDGHRDFLEIAPHPVLKASIEECLAEAGKRGTVVVTLKRKGDDHVNLLSSLGELYTLGYQLDWASISSPRTFHRFPKYPWQREWHWKESAVSRSYRLEAAPHPLISRRTHPQAAAWEFDVDLYRLPYLRDHQIQGSVVFPGACYVELAWAAGREAFGTTANAMSIEFKNALYIASGELPRLFVSFAPDRGNFSIWSQAAGDAARTLHACGQIWNQQRTGQSDVAPLVASIERCHHELSASACYAQFARLGLEYGACFQGLAWLRQGKLEAVAKLSLHEAVEAGAGQYKIHPVALDQCFQVLAAALPFPAAEADSKVYMPVSVEEGFVYEAPRSGMYIVGRITEHTDDTLKGDIFVLDEQERVVAEIRGCKAIRLDQRAAGGVRDLVQGRYSPQWIDARDVATAAASESQPDQHVVVLADSFGLGDHLCELLTSEGRECSWIGRGTPHEGGAHRQWVDERNAASMDAALERIASQTTAPIKLVYLWGLEAEPLALAETLPLACHAASTRLLGVMQAIERSNLAARCAVVLVTRGGQILKGDLPDARQLAQAALWGLGRVMGHQEYADCWAGMIDLDPGTPRDEARRLLEELDLAGGEDQIALRGDRRHVMRLLPLPEQDASLPARIRSDATYIITGGLGSIGLLVAQWLADRGARHLVLVGRSALPDRAYWHAVSADDAKYPVITALQRLESLGVNVELTRLDVADEGAISDLLIRRAKMGHPSVRGVIHSAGLAKPMLMRGMDGEHLREIFRPKVDGGWALHRALASARLDFFVLFSSVASVVTSPGQGAYAAANAYLDALAAFRRAHGLTATSVNWGPWGEVGMATQFNDLKTYFENRGMFPMRSARGIQALEQTLGSEHSQVLVMAADWKQLRDANYPPGISPAFLTELGAGEPQAEGERVLDSAEAAAIFVAETLPAAAPEARAGLMAEYLIDLAASVLRISSEQRASVSPEMPFNRLGLDSMMAIELKNLIAKRVGTPIAVVDLLNGSPCIALAQKLVQQLGLNAQAEASAQVLATESA